MQDQIRIPSVGADNESIRRVISFRLLRPYGATLQVLATKTLAMKFLVEALCRNKFP